MTRTLVLPAALLLFLAMAPMTAAATESTTGSDAAPLPEKDDEAGEKTSPEDKKPFNEFDLGDFMEITLHGDFWAYHIRTKNTYHTSATAAFTEFTARFGADFSFRNAEWIAAQFRVAATNVDGRPENWTFPRRKDWGARFDLANVTLKGGLGGMDTSLTAGLQELCYGDGFLIFDGITDKRAVWTTPLRSFPAVKWSLSPSSGCTIDLFAALVDEDHLSYEAYLGSGIGIEGGGQLYGADLNHASDLLGTLDLGLFLKDEDIRRGENAGLDSGSNTWALSLRDSKDFGPVNVTGEVVKEWGRTRVVRNSLSAANGVHRRDAWGGNLSLKYTFGAGEEAPFLKARYAYFQGDRKGTPAVESFDPFYYGFYDWGYWYLGDMTSYSLTNTNERAASLEFGFTPVARTRLRVFFYDFSLDKETPLVTTRSWSNEVNVVFDYFPSDYVFLGAMAGAAVPGSAAETFNGDDRTQTEVMVWAGLSF